MVAMPMETALRSRASVREYSGEPLELTELSDLLRLSHGEIGQALLDDGVTVRPRRASPSGGGLYPIEVYVVALRVRGLDQGLYHYQPRDHSLECIRRGDLQPLAERAILYPDIVARAGVVVLLGALFHRHRFKYGERGYRFTLLDAGHLAQNVYLLSAALNVGCVAIGGYLDDEINELVGMNGVDEAVVYLLAVGRPRTTETATSAESQVG